MHRADVLVVGAGPAGLATAIAFARRGLEACVVDRRRAPLDKACGEGIMPAGVRALQRLGVVTDQLDAAAFEGVRFVEGAIACEGRFAGGTGLGVRRTELSRALIDVATRAGVEIRLGCSLRDFDRDGDVVRARTRDGDWRVRLLVGADGLHSTVRERAGLSGPDRARRFGLRRHFRIAPWSRLVEVHWCDRGEAYVTPVARDEVGVAILGAAKDRDFDRELARFPEVVARLAGAAPVDGVRGAGPFWQSAKRPAAERVALVGDAAGYTDAVTGEGISLAIRGAEALARIFAESDGVVGYDRAWRGITREHRAFAALLRLAVDHPGSRRAAFRALARMPWFFEVLLRRAGEVDQALPGTGPRCEASASPTS
ncbi:MAG: NAD(P)/FAD-dependent oxidoreductase [Myxococcales bacterium]|nr:NAD(P)/FAD-dependent oxidoreductase [Myxococcales bacterium]